MVGVAVIIAILIIVPDQHASVDFVFTERFNNSGLFGDGISGLGFWFYVLPLGFLLTMYTQTGYDASAHISEETKGAALGAAKGVWRSVFCAGVIGWLVLLAITFAASDAKFVNDPANGFGLGSSLAIFDSALGSGAAKAVILIATDRPALLRHGLPDQRLAHVLRVLAGSGRTRPSDLDAAQPPPRARILGDLHGDAGACW